MGAKRAKPDRDTPRPFRNDLITLARRARGVSQSDLAKMLGLSQAMVSRFEEHSEPTPGQVERIAEALDYPPSFFYITDPIYGFGVGELFHRRRKAIPARVLDEIHAEMNVRIMTVSRLLKAVELPDANLPAVDRVDRPMTPEDAARSIRARWLIPPGPIRSVTEILDRAGIVVVPCDFRTDLMDAIGLWPTQSPPFVFVNTNIPQDRLRLTLMHEIAHLVLHHGWSLDSGAEIEEEATRFAAEFLLPAKEVKRDLLGLTVPGLAQLKRYWRVSMGALLVRAKELRCITERRYQTLWTEMGKLGYRTREPGELDVKGERPGALIDEMVRIHREELQYSADELAQRVNLTPREFGTKYLHEPPGLRIVRNHRPSLERRGQNGAC